MNETPISKPIIAVNKANGTNVNTETRMLLLNIWNRPPALTLLRELKHGGK